jgi:predicted molibdopterin-dependent oxidoreductase YjgC
MLSNEAMHLLSRVLERSGGRGVFAVKTGPEAPLAGVDDLSLRRDRAANVAGAELCGFERREVGDLLVGLAAGDVLLVADEELDGVRLAVPAGVRIVVIGTVVPAWAAAADVVLPTSNMAEEEGTFTNLRGRVQRFFQAKSPPGLARASWSVYGDLLAAMGEGAGYWSAAEAFDALAAARPRFAGLSYDTLALRGELLANANAPEPAAAGVA